MLKRGLAMPDSFSPAASTNRADDAWNIPFLRIGHGGAAGHARANSIRSLTLALELGVDVVEFDVRPCRDALVLLHDDNLGAFASQELLNACTLAELRGLDTGPDGPIPTLVEALHLIKGRALINVDLKAAGYEEAVLEAVCAEAMLDDVLFSSLIPASLRRLKQLAPNAQTGLSYPEDRGNASGNPYLAPAVNVVVAWMRLTLPYRVPAMMTDAQANAVMLYHKVVSRPTVQTVHRAGGKVFAWTVDDLTQMRRLYALGVNGIASNRPELLAQFKRPIE
jgi:glycerophosphoryl diester phosphodiesterase